MKKYYVIFRWYNFRYYPELLMKRSYYVKATNSKEAEHKAFEKFDKEFNLPEENDFNIVDEISIKNIKVKRKHRKDRYNLIYTL